MRLTHSFFMITITKVHKDQFREMQKRVSVIGHKESTFTSIEVLFYEALTIARSYGSQESNPLLAELKKIEENEYRQTTELFRKSAQREKVIRRFIMKFRGFLSASAKSVAPQAGGVAG